MNKIFGYLLICAGLMLMLFSVMGMYKVFADRQPAAPVVQMADLRINTQYGPMQIPMQGVNQIANLGLFAVLMMFILSAGAKLAGVGNAMLKTERIHDALLQIQAQNAPAEQTLKKL